MDHSLWCHLCGFPINNSNEYSPPVECKCAYVSSKLTGLLRRPGNSQATDPECIKNSSLMEVGTPRRFILVELRDLSVCVDSIHDENPKHQQSSFPLTHRVTKTVEITSVDGWIQKCERCFIPHGDAVISHSCQFDRDHLRQGHPKCSSKQQHT